MAAITDVAIVNRSSIVPDAMLQGYISALQTQITRDLAPWWGIDAKLHLVGAHEPVPAGMWPLWIQDHSPEPGDLGFHETANDGLPDGRVFAADDARYGASLSVTISHELLEMLVNPTTQRMITINGFDYLVEVGDPVEADDDGYAIDGVQVSNFVTPLYFGMSPTAQPGRFDMCNRLQRGCPSLRPGGYCMWLRAGDAQWHSTMARLADGSLSYRAIRRGGRSYRAAALKAP